MKRYDKLLSPAFLIGLTLLLLNDFVLKPQFHNSLTGKLSDFAGLFIFPMFFTAFVPRFKIQIYILTAILFVLWKSPLSQPVINAWNSLTILRIGRTVDYSDLFALVILPISFFYIVSRPIKRNRAAIISVVCISLFAFTATSIAGKHYDYNKEYLFQESKAELLRKIARLNLKYFFTYRATPGDEENMISFEMQSDFCSSTVLTMVAEVKELKGKGIIVLKEINHKCPKEDREGNKEKVLQIFENQFIDKLKAAN